MEQWQKDALFMAAWWSLVFIFGFIHDRIQKRKNTNRRKK